FSLNSMVLAARSISDNRRMAGSSSLMAATVGSMLLTSRAVLVPKIFARMVSTIMNGLVTGGSPQLPFYSVKDDGRRKAALAASTRGFRTISEKRFALEDGEMPLRRRGSPLGQSEPRRGRSSRRFPRGNPRRKKSGGRPLRQHSREEAQHRRPDESRRRGT